MWVGAHASFAFGASSGELGFETTHLNQQFVRSIALIIVREFDVLGFSCISPIGTWCERQKPSAAFA